MSEALRPRAGFVQEEVSTFWTEKKKPKEKSQRGGLDVFGGEEKSQEKAKEKSKEGENEKARKEKVRSRRIPSNFWAALSMTSRDPDFCPTPVIVPFHRLTA
ncbi:hypothetical protein NL676_013454 [Syzygium grande]|nr:hypothetical protein NL676_013454 [Syzygium grande]